MLKKDWKKNLLRVKQLADQGLGRAEKSEVLSEELLCLEKRVEIIRQVCHSTHKKVGMCLQTAGLDREKRLRKMPESQLASSMLESAEQLGIETLLGQMFQLCGNAVNTVANDLLQYELNVENDVLSPVQGLIDNDIPAIQKQRKHLNKFTIDMDVARSRYQSVVKQNHAGNASAAKTDNFRDEMEDTAHKVEQCRDQLSTDMYAFLARESEYSGYLLELVKANIQYHQRSLDVLERLVPQMEEQIVHSTHSPVYGVQLEEHLRRGNRDISVVLEDCVCTLLEVGMEEEGLFRVAGSSSKVKKLKAAFDFGMVDMSEHVRDIHCVAGALKLYLRELPEPLMTFSLYSEWMHAARLPQLDQRLPALWQVVNQLPKLNYNNLRYLIKFLAKLAELESVNKMSASNIAIVMGPNLIWAPGDGGPNVLNTSIQSAVVELFITYHEYFFEEDVDFSVTSASSSQGSPVSIATNGSGTATALYPSLQYAADPQPIQPYVVSPVASAPPAAAMLSNTTTPPGSLSSSQDNLLQPTSPSDSPVGTISPRAPRRGTKKPAPLPPPGVGAATGPVPFERPSISEKPSVAEKPPYAHSMSTMSSSSSTSSSESPQLIVSPPIEKLGSTTPLVERPMVPPPAPPVRPEKPSSPLPERPRNQPPERPSIPPPEKPDRPPSLPHGRQGSEKDEDRKPDRPEKPEKPEKPAKPADGYGTLGRGGSTRPPRPQPPPPPPPERRSSADKPEKPDKQAPLAIAEDDGVGCGSPEPSPKAVTEETHL